MSDPLLPPHPTSDPDRLAALDAYGLTDADADAGFDGAVLLARALCAAPAALISLVGDDRQWFLARSGFGTASTPLRHSVCVHALDSDRLLVIPDLTHDVRTARNPLVSGETGLRFYAGAPLRTPEGQILGSLCVLDTYSRPDGLSMEQAEGLQTLARLVMTQLDLRRRLRLHVVEIERLQAGSTPSVEAEVSCHLGP